MKHILWLSGIAVSLCSTAVGQEAYPAGPGALAPLVKAEYFFDTDPGLGNGTSLALTSSTNIANFSTTIALNGTGLTNGFHNLYLRVQDADGKWSLSNIGFFDNVAVPLYPAAATVPGLSGAEYFIDNDPGPGNGTPIVLPSITNAANINVLVNLVGLSAGVHRLFIRTRDAEGRWSLANYTLFDNSATIPYPTAPAAAPPIGQVEYYLDSDPGFGNGLPISVGTSTEVANFSFSVPLTGVAQGPHTLYLRSKQNPWSMSAYADFTLGATLPVHWLYVKGEVKTDGTLLSWATGMEQQADKFIVEYSTDGATYLPAGELKATNQPNGSTYSWLHRHTTSGVVYYRIKQTDLDGNYEYSKTIVLLFRNNLPSYALFPNPAIDRIHVALPPQRAVIGLSVYNSDGRLLQKMPVTGSSSVVSMPVSQLLKGTYYLVIEEKSGKTTHPFVKQ